MNERQFSDLLKKLKIPTNNRSYADIFDLLDAKLSEYLDRQDAASQELIDDIQDALDYAELKKNEVGSGIALKREDDEQEEDEADLDELRDASKKALEEANGQASALHDAINAALSAATQQTQQMNQVAWRRAGKLWFSSITGAENINTMFFQALDDLKYGDFDHANSIFEAILQVEPNNASAYLGRVMVTYKIKEIREIGSTYDKDIFSDINMRRAYDHGDNQQKQYLDDARKEVESGIKYKNADKKAQRTGDEAAQAEAAKLFGELGTYRDAAKRKEQCEERRKEILHKKQKDDIVAQFMILVSQFDGIAKAIISQYKNAIHTGKPVTPPIDVDELRKKANAVIKYAEENDEVKSLENEKELIASVEASLEEIVQLVEEYTVLSGERKSEKKADILVGLAVVAILFLVGFPAPNGNTMSFLTRLPVRTTEDVLYVKNALSKEITSFSSFHEMILERSSYVESIVCPMAKIEQMTLKSGYYKNLKIPKSVKKLSLDNVWGCQIPKTVEEVYITGNCQDIDIPDDVDVYYE